MTVSIWKKIVEKLINSVLKTTCKKNLEFLYIYIYILKNVGDIFSHIDRPYLMSLIHIFNRSSMNGSERKMMFYLFHFCWC